MKALIMLFKLSPIFVLCGLVMSGFDMLMAAPMAFLYAVIVCKITTKRKVMDVMDSAMVNVKKCDYGIFFLYAGLWSSSFLHDHRRRGKCYNGCFKNRNQWK